MNSYNEPKLNKSLKIDIREKKNLLDFSPVLASYYNRDEERTTISF